MCLLQQRCAVCSKEAPSVLAPACVSAGMGRCSLPVRALARLLWQHRAQVLASAARHAHNVRCPPAGVMASHGMAACARDMPPDGEVPGCAERRCRAQAQGARLRAAAGTCGACGTPGRRGRPRPPARTGRPMRRRAPSAAHPRLQVALLGYSSRDQACIHAAFACMLHTGMRTPDHRGAPRRAPAPGWRRPAPLRRAAGTAGRQGRPGRAAAPGCSGAGGRGCWRTRRSAAPRAARPSARPAAAAAAAGRRGPGRPAPAQTRSACAPAARRAAAGICAVMVPWQAPYRHA